MCVKFRTVEVHNDLLADYMPSSCAILCYVLDP
jgi:hypothetical protein